MKFLVLGATGPTGQQVVNEALDGGHDVIALVRAPDRMTTQHERLKVVQGDVTSPTPVAEQLQGCDAVLSCLGGKPGVFTPCDVYTSSMKAVSQAMKDKGVKRFICITAWGTKDDPRLPFVWRWVLKPSMLKNVVQDMSLMEDYLASEDCEHLNYTVVKPPRLLNTPSQGKLQRQEGQLVPGADASGVSRQDVARCVLDCLHTSDWDRKLMAVGPPEKDG